MTFVITNVIKSNNYNSAIQMLESGQYQEAYDLFCELGNYKDSEKQMDNAKIKTQISNLKNINVGDVIKFGIYKHEDIEWQVLDKKDNEIFVISKYIVRYCEYQYIDGYYEYDGSDWENSYVRKNLNSSFYGSSFNEDAKAMIQTTNVIYKDENGTEKNTADKLFILSVDEYNKYFKNPSEAECTPAKNSESLSYVYNPYCWVLRSPVVNNNKIEYVNFNGKVTRSGATYFDFLGVRPAMWINLEK